MQGGGVEGGGGITGGRPSLAIATAGAKIDIKNATTKTITLCFLIERIVPPLPQYIPATTMPFLQHIIL
jgi:hypothetical protein